MIVYKTTNLINGMIYVGKDSNDNPNYLGSGLHLKRAIKKYGRENFAKDILEVCDLSNINEREIYWIAKLNARDRKIGYNICIGGEGLGSGVNHPSYGKPGRCMKGELNPLFGKSVSKETKQRISLSLLGKQLSEEHRFKCGKHRIGKKQTEETKRKIALSRIGKKFPRSKEVVN